MKNINDMNDMNNMSDFFIPISSQQRKKEKNKAYKLRKSNWWKQKIQEGKCYYCQKIFPTTELTMDHKIPLVRGGKSSKNNIVAACKKCNNLKKYDLSIDYQSNLKID